MRKIKAAVLGCGDRGSRYAAYSLEEPEGLEIIAATDINPLKLSQFKEKYSLKDDMLFSDLNGFLAKKPECDIVINCTMDEAHYETTMALLKAGYNVLLEKPITAVPAELAALGKEAAAHLVAPSLAGSAAICPGAPRAGPVEGCRALDARTK